MNTYLLAAGLLTALIGLAHSVIGEIMIFKALRCGSWIPTQGGSALREFQVRILWASWHVVSVLGGALAAILLHMSGAVAMPLIDWLTISLLTALVASAMLVLIGTRGRHPAWVGLLLVAALIFLV